MDAGETKLDFVYLKCIQHIKLYDIKYIIVIWKLIELSCLNIAFWKGYGTMLNLYDSSYR